MARKPLLPTEQPPQELPESEPREQQKDDFVSVVSHELRTPLTIIQEGVSQLRDGVLGGINGEQRRCLSTILEHIERLSRIIQDLLDMSKLEAGKLRMRKKMTCIAKVAGGVCEDFRGMFQKKGLELRTNFPKSPTALYLDEDKITQVFTNLIENALKFTPKGFVEVSIVDQKDAVECRVSDTGNGIDPDDLQKVFEKFEQSARTCGGGAKGTGLGLAIAKVAVELHRGKIWVESQVGRGTQAVFLIPKTTARQIFQECIARALQRALKEEEPLSLAIMDIQLEGVFRRQLGEKRADEILRTLEDLANQRLRRKDDLVYWENQYLMMLLPETNKNQARPALERVEESVRSFLEEKDLDGGIGADFRVISFPDDARTLDELFKQVWPGDIAQKGGRDVQE